MTAAAPTFDFRRELGGAWPLAIVGVALVVVCWSAAVGQALDAGMYTYDTLHYHGPFTARFVQDGSLADLKFVYPDPPVTFFPGNSELLHAVGALLFSRDVPSPLLNLGWLGLALLAAWSLGRPYGVAPATLLMAALVLGSPGMLSTQPGGTYTDVVVAALTLSVAAFLVHARNRRAPLVLAGAAAGLAVGTKATMLGPAGVLTLGIAWLARPATRVARLTAWGLPLLVTGGGWYLRNLVQVGNPLPAVHLALGPLELPAPPLPQAHSVAHYATNPRHWEDTFLPVLDQRFGPLWWAIIGLAALGLIAATLARENPMVRLLGIAGLATCFAWFFTPRTGGTLPGHPTFFGDGLRYLTPVLALGLALLPTVPPLSRIARHSAFVAVLAVAVAVTALDWDFGPAAPSDAWLTAPILAAVASLALATTLVLRRPGAGPLTFLAVVMVASVAGSWAVARHYLHGRYAEGSGAWVANAGRASFGVAGGVGTYALFGADLRNRVEYISQPHDRRGSFLPIESCRQYRRALAGGDYDYVVTSPRLTTGKPPREWVLGQYFGVLEPESEWTRSYPGADLVRQEPGDVNVFRLASPAPSRLDTNCN